MKIATYYLPDLQEIKGVVLTEEIGPDGPVVTLAENEDAAPFIRRAPVSAAPQPGHAVIDAKAEADAKAKAKKNK